MGWFRTLPSILSTQSTTTTMSFRIDHNLATNHKLFFSYSSRDQEQLNGTPNIPGLLDPNFFKSRFSHYIRFGWDDTSVQLSSTI